MSLAKDYFRDDFDKKPEELEREADDVRADMEKTLDQLMDQLSPGEMLNHALGTFKSSGDSAFTRNLVNQVQNNPLPAILAGCSLTWLMAASKQPPASPAGHGRVGEAKDKMSSVTGSARSKAQNAASTTSNLKEQMSGSSQHAAESARANAQAAQQSYNDLLKEQPLMMGALAVAVGAALGALIPSSRAEDEMVGEKSEETKEELKEKAQQKMEEGQTQASSSGQQKTESDSQQHTQSSTADPMRQSQRSKPNSETNRDPTWG